MNVPKRIFKGTDAVIDEKELKKFRDLTMARCPWINANSFEVLMRKAREEYLKLKDEETGGISTSRKLASEGNLKGAAERLRAHLAEDPDDADAWLELGQILCQMGDTAEGYKAINEARKHY